MGFLSLSRGERTAVELFVAGVRGWEAGIRRRVVNSESMMTHSDLARQRLLNQHIARPRFAKPAEIVAWLGAVQAQDFAGAKWSLGLR